MMRWAPAAPTSAPLVLHGPANTLNWMDETHHILRSFSKKRLGRLQRQSCFLNWFARLSAVQTKSSTKWRPPPLPHTEWFGLGHRYGGPAAPHRVVWPWPSYAGAAAPHRVVWPWPFNPSTAAWFPPSIRWTSRLAPPSPSHRSAMFLHLSPIHGSQPKICLGPEQRGTLFKLSVNDATNIDHPPILTIFAAFLADECYVIR